MGLPRSVLTQAGPCSGPKYRVAARSYSGLTSLSSSTLECPRTSITLCGQALSSIVSATLGSAASALSLGAFGGDPRTNLSPVQRNQIGTTRGDPSIQG